MSKRFTPSLPKLAEDRVYDACLVAYRFAKSRLNLAKTRRQRALRKLTTTTHDAHGHTWVQRYESDRWVRDTKTDDGFYMAVVYDPASGPAAYAGTGSYDNFNGYDSIAVNTKTFSDMMEDGMRRALELLEEFKAAKKQPTKA